MKMAFLKHLFFIVLCSYLFSEWKKAASKSHVLFAVYEKRLKKQFFGAEYRFFVNDNRFDPKHF